MTKRLTFLLLLFFSFHTLADSPPTPELIKQWWAKHSTELLDVTEAPLEVRLRSKEPAYLLEVDFAQRGRNFAARSVLIRPLLQEVREVSSPVSRSNVVYDLDQDGVSEVVSTEVGSGQGYTDGSLTIIQFDEWTPVTLFQRDFANYNAWGEDDYRFYDKSVDWQFVDLDKDGKLDLVEVTTYQNGRNQRPPVVETIRRKFMFKNNAFIKYVDYKKQLPR